MFLHSKYLPEHCPNTAASYLLVLKSYPVCSCLSNLERVTLLFQLMRTGMHYCLRLGCRHITGLNYTHFYLTGVDAGSESTSDRNVLQKCLVHSNVVVNSTCHCVCVFSVNMSLTVIMGHIWSCLLPALHNLTLVKSNSPQSISEDLCLTEVIFYCFGTLLSTILLIIKIINIQMHFFLSVIVKLFPNLLESCIIS